VHYSPLSISVLSFFNGHFLLGASLVVAIQAVKKGAASEGMKLRDYIWRGHDPTSVAVMTEVITCCTYSYLVPKHVQVYLV